MGLTRLEQDSCVDIPACFFGRGVEFPGSSNQLLAPRELPSSGGGTSGCATHSQLGPLAMLAQLCHAGAVLMLSFVLQPFAPVRKGLWPEPVQGVKISPSLVQVLPFLSNTPC